MILCLYHLLHWTQVGFRKRVGFGSCPLQITLQNGQIFKNRERLLRMLNTIMKVIIYKCEGTHWMWKVLMADILKLTVYSVFSIANWRVCWKVRVRSMFVFMEQLLIEKKADLDSRNHRNETPLFWAVNNQHFSVAASLISAGIPVFLFQFLM